MNVTWTDHFLPTAKIRTQRDGKEERAASKGDESEEKEQNDIRMNRRHSKRKTVQRCSTNCMVQR